MAYNSLKRIFGETRLELKLLFLFGVGLLVIIATAFWWYGSNTAKLVYEQNRNTAAVDASGEQVATHLGASRANRIAPLSFLPPRKRSTEERQWIEFNKKEFSKHAGEGRVDLVARSSRQRAPRATTRRKPKSARSSSATRPDPSKSDEPKKTEYKEDRRARLSLLRADPRQGQLFDRCAMPRPLAAAASTPWARSAFRRSGGAPRPARPHFNPAT